MMRGAAAAATTSGIGVGVCPRPSYRSYLAALAACSRAAPAPTAATGSSPSGGGGDWRASKEVLAMMWEDEAARAAEENTAVPGARYAWNKEGGGGGGNSGGGGCGGRRDASAVYLLINSQSWQALFPFRVIYFCALSRNGRVAVRFCEEVRTIEGGTEGGEGAWPEPRRGGGFTRAFFVSSSEWPQLFDLMVRQCTPPPPYPLLLFPLSSQPLPSRPLTSPPLPFRLPRAQHNTKN